MIFIIRFRLLAIPLALDKSHLPYRLTGLYPHNTGNHFAYRLAAHRTCIHRGFPFSDGRRQAGTAWETAAPAVISRQRIQHRLFLLIHLHFKLNGRNA